MARNVICCIMVCVSISMALETTAFLLSHPYLVSHQHRSPALVQWRSDNKDNGRIGHRSRVYSDCSKETTIRMTIGDGGEKRSSSCRSVLNPLTKRYIQQTNIPQDDDDNRKGCSTTGRWYKFMSEEGGYIAHRGVLVPIHLQLLPSSSNNHRDLAPVPPPNDAGFPPPDGEWNPILPSYTAFDGTPHAPIPDAGTKEEPPPPAVMMGCFG